MLHNKILKTYKDIPKTYLAEDDTDIGKVKLLCCKIDDYEYRFNVDWVPEDKLDWLAQIYSDDLRVLKRRTEEKVRKEISDKFYEFIHSMPKQ